MRKKITAFIMVLVMIVCAGVLPDGVAYAEDIFNSGSIKMVSAGNDYTAIVKEDGSLWMVGRNNSGQFGNGTKNSSTTPVKIMDDVKAVSAGSDYTAIIKNDGSLWMVGINNYGQLGDGTTISRSTPVFVTTNVKSVSTIGNLHTAILKEDNSLWMVGRNDYGQLGDGTSTNKTTPQMVMDRVFFAGAGDRYTAILKEDKSLWMVGLNDYGQLGDGTTENREMPVSIMTEVDSISTRRLHSAIIKDDGSLWMVGLNEYGQLGNGTTTNSNVPINTMTNVRFVSAGYNHTAVIKEDGSLWMMGENIYGQLGDGTTISKNIPVGIMVGVKSVSAGYRHSAILKEDGSLWMVGQNDYGQLGDGTTINKSTPIKIFDGNGENNESFFDGFQDKKIEACKQIESAHYTGNMGDSFIDNLVQEKRQDSNARRWAVGQNDYTNKDWDEGSVISIARWSGGSEISWAYEVMDIGGLYKYFSAKILKGYSTNSENYSMNLSFIDYETDTVLETYEINQNTLEFDVYVNVEGVRYLKILVKDNKPAGRRCTYLMLDGILSNNKKESGDGENTTTIHVKDDHEVYPLDFDLEFDWDLDKLVNIPESYDKSLAIAALAMSTDIYKCRGNDSSALQSLLKKLGVEGTISYNLVEAGEIRAVATMVPYGIYNIVVIVGRGTSDFYDMLTDANPWGFESRAIKVLNGIKEEANKKHITLDYENTRFFLAGHSLGGAVANIASQLLINVDGVKPEHLTCYTYESPITTRNSEKNNSLYKNIYNIFNDNDIVPKVGQNEGNNSVRDSLYGWFGGRYGIDINVGGEEYRKPGSNYYNTYRQITGNTWREKGANDDPFYYHYTPVCWTYILSGQELEVKVNSTTKVYKISFADGIGGSIITKVNSITRVIKVLCPVDIAVYNPSGELVVSVINDKIIRSGDYNVNVIVDGDKKYLIFTDAGEADDYKIKISAYDDGEMYLSTQDIVNGEPSVEEAELKNIQLYKNKEILMKVKQHQSVMNVDVYTVDKNEKRMNNISKNGTETPASMDSHTHYGKWVVITNPTSNSNGKKVLVCFICGESSNERVINSNGIEPGSQGSSSASGTASSGTSLTRPPVTTQNGGTTTNNNQKDKDADKDTSENGGVKYFTLYRLYNAKSGEHLYTIDTNESAELVCLGWQQETTPGEALSKGVPIYRLYNPASGGHLYTPDENECKVLTSEFGWVYDNNKKPVFYGKVGDGTSVFRLYNPGIKSLAANHHYVSDKTEIEYLIQNGGWVYDNDKAPVFILK